MRTVLQAKVFVVERESKMDCKVDHSWAMHVDGCELIAKAKFHRGTVAGDWLVVTTDSSSATTDSSITFVFQILGGVQPCGCPVVSDVADTAYAGLSNGKPDALHNAMCATWKKKPAGIVEA